MKTPALAVFAAFTLGGAAAHAADITYTGNYTANPVTAYYTITTDGVIGSVSEQDVVALQISFFSPQGEQTYSLAEGDASIDTNADFLIASPSSLNVKYYGNVSLVGNSASGDFGSVHWYPDFDFAKVTVRTQNGDSSGSAFFTGGEIASVSAAPEPSTWALLLAGIAMIGTTLRLGRRKGVMAVA